MACAIASGTAPSGVTCTVPAPFALSASAVSQNVTFTTIPRVITPGGLSLAGNRSRWALTLTLAMAGLLMLFASRGHRLGRLTVRGAGLFTLLLAFCVPAIGCNNNNSSGTSTSFTGTPAGTYNYTVTATSGAVVHAETVALTVN